MYCTQCGKELSKKDMKPEKNIAVCPGCNTVSYMANPDQELAKIAMVKMPKSMSVKETGGNLEIAFRWLSPRNIFFSFFSIIWYIAMYQMFTQKTPLNLSVSFILIVITFIVTYINTAIFINNSVINVKDGKLSIFHRPLPWIDNREIDVNDLKQLYCREHWKTSTYSLNAIMKTGEHKEFITNLFDEAEPVLFIEQEMERHLGIKDQSVRGEKQKDV